MIFILLFLFAVSIRSTPVQFVQRSPRESTDPCFSSGSGLSGFLRSPLAAAEEKKIHRTEPGLRFMTSSGSLDSAPVSKRAKTHESSISGMSGEPGGGYPPGLAVEYVAPVEEHQIGTPAVGGGAASDTPDEEMLTQRQTGQASSSSMVEPRPPLPAIPPPVVNDQTQGVGAVNVGAGFVQQGQYVPMGSGLPNLAGPTNMGMIGNIGMQGGQGMIPQVQMQMPTAAGGGMIGNQPQMNFIQQHGSPSVYDHAIAQKMMQRTSLLANQNQQMGAEVQQLLQVGDSNFQQFSQGVTQFQNQTQQQQQALEQQQQLQREEQARIQQQQMLQQQEQQLIQAQAQAQQQQLLQQQQLQQQQNAQQAVQLQSNLQNHLQGFDQRYASQQGIIGMQGEAIANLTRELKEMRGMMQQQSSSASAGNSKGTASATAHEFLFPGGANPGAGNQTGGGVSTGAGRHPPPPPAPQPQPQPMMSQMMMNPMAPNFAQAPGFQQQNYGYGSAMGMGAGSPQRPHGFLGYHAETVPLPSTANPTGGPATVGGPVERRIFRFTKISFESEHKLTFQKRPGVKMVMKAKDRMPDRAAPKQQSYNSLEEWLAAVESYLLRFVHLPGENDDAYLFPEELENELIEDLLYGEAADDGGKASSSSKFRGAMPTKMKEKVRRLRFERKNRHTLTFLNLTYNLYTEYPRSFVLNRDERDAFMNFTRNSGEDDAQMLGRYVQVAQNAGENIYPPTLEARQKVWDELTRKVPDMDIDQVTTMMMSERYASPQVPFIENYVSFLYHRGDYANFMLRRKKAGKADERVAAGREFVAAAKADPKSAYKYNPRNPSGNFSTGRAGGGKGAGAPRSQSAPGKGGGKGKGKGRAIRCKFCWGSHPTSECKYTEPVCRICFKSDHFEANCPNKRDTKVAAVMATETFRQKPIVERVAAILQELSAGEKERVMLLTVDDQDVERKYIVDDQTISGNRERVFCTEVNDEYAEYCEVVLGALDDTEEQPAAGEYEPEMDLNVPGPPLTEYSDDGEQEVVRLVREPRTVVLSGQEIDLEKFDVTFFATALKASGYGCGKSTEPTDGGEFCATEVASEVRKILDDNGFGEAAVGNLEEEALFTTERDTAQLDSGYTKQVYVARKAAQANKQLAEENGLRVPTQQVDGTSHGIGGSKQRIFGKVALPYIVRRKADRSVYCYGFQKLTVTEHGPNLCGLEFQKQNFCSTICEVGTPEHIRGHDGSCILDFEGKEQIFLDVFSYTKDDFEVLRQIQILNKEEDWCRPVFSVPLDPVKVAAHAPQFPYDPRPISFYRQKADEEKLAAEEVVLFTTEESQSELGMFHAQQQELAVETGGEIHEEESAMAEEKDLHRGALSVSDVPRAFLQTSERAEGGQLISPALYGTLESQMGTGRVFEQAAAGAAGEADLSPDKQENRTEIALPIAGAAGQQQSLWEVNSHQLRRQGDTGGYAVLRVTDYGLEKTPPIPPWLKNRIRLRRVVDVLRQDRACPDLVDDWKKRKNQLEFDIPGGRSRYVTIDYYYHLPDSVPKGAPSWMSRAEREDYQKRKVDPHRGNLSIEQHQASIVIESGIRYEHIGRGIVKPNVHNAPNSERLLKVPGKLEDVRIFTCRDLADVPPVVRETAKVFRVEEHDDMPTFSTGQWRFRPNLTQRVVETGFSDNIIGQVTDEMLKPITAHLRGGKRAILQCSSGVGLSVAVAERLRSSVYGKNGKVYHASAPIELFIHDLSIMPNGIGIRYTAEERLRVDTVLSPLRIMSAEERRKVRLIQEVLFLHGKLQSEQKCLERARGQLRDVDEKALVQLTRVARRDSMARLNLALGVRRGNLGSLTLYEALRTGGVTYLDTTFFTEFGFIYSAVGGLSGSDGRGRHSVSGLKWKLEPFLKKSGLTEEEQEILRQGIMFNFQDSYATRLLRGKASPSVEDVARAIRRFLSLYIVRRRLYGDAGLENLGLKAWKSLVDSGREVKILPSGKAVYKLERRFLSVKTAHKRLRRLPEFHAMGLQHLLDEIDEMLDHLSTVRLNGRSPAQAFWGLEESRPEMLTHPDDTAVARHSWGEMNIHRLTEGRLRITSELLAMQTDEEFVTDVKKIVANCRAQMRSRDEEENWQVGDELNFYNAKNKTDKRVRLLQKIPDQGSSGFTYVCQGDGKLISARKENLSGGFDFDHVFNLPDGLQPIVAADFKRNGRMYQHQKLWAENNLMDADLELQVPANASSHEAGPFFSFDPPPPRGTKKKNLGNEEMDGGDDSEEVEVSEDEAPLPPVAEVMAAPVPEGEVLEDGIVNEEPGGAEESGSGDLGFVELVGGVFDGLREDPICRNSCFVMTSPHEETLEERVAAAAEEDVWEETATTITRVHGKVRRARCTPTKIRGVNPDIGDMLENHRITEYSMLGKKELEPRRQLCDLWKEGDQDSPTAHADVEDGRKWVGKTIFFKKLAHIGRNMITEVEEVVLSAKQQEPEPPEGEQESDDDNDPARPRMLDEFLVNPKREARRVINKQLWHNPGPIKEDSMLWQLMIAKMFERIDGVQLSPVAMETCRGWQEERRELSDPATQREVLLSWGKRQVAVVNSQEEFKQKGGENLVRLVLCSLAPTVSRPDLGLISVHDPQTSQHPEIVEKLHGALKFADADHSFIESSRGLGIPDQLLRAHEAEWEKLFKNELIEKWEPGAPCADEGILTARAIADLKLKTRWHYTVAVRLVPGGHKSTVSATAESPTLSELELRLIIGRLRRVKGKRVLRSGDVPRAFLKNLRFKMENRPRFRFPFNITQEYILRSLKSRFGIAPGDIFVMNISLYGLREAALMWYRTLSQFLHSIGYRSTSSSPCVFRKGQSYVGIHVDDLLFSGNEEDFQEFAAALRSRFGLETWNDAVDGIVFTGIQIHFDEAAEKVRLSMSQKIAELQPATVPADQERKLNEEEISELKGRRGSLLFIGRAHPEVTFPTRCLAIGSDADKDARWTSSQNAIISRAKQESPGTVIDLSYRDEVLAMFPDASFQQPTSDEAVGAGDEQPTELVNLNTHYGGGQVRGREIGAWRKEDSRNTYIGRGSKWGNPFRAPRDGNRDEVIQKYKEYIHATGLRKQVHELRGRRLGCFCAPFPCHGDVLLEALCEDEEVLCAPAEEDEQEQLEKELEERRAFARDYGMEYLKDFDYCEHVMSTTEKSETSRRKRKRFAAVELPSTEEDPVSRKAKQLRGQLGYVFLSLSKDDWEEYERRQVAVKRVETLKEYNDLETLKIRCSYLHGDSFFQASPSPSSYDVELHSLGEAIPVLEMTLAKLRNWQVRVPSVVLSDSRSAVLRVVSKSVISFADAAVFKILARVKSSYTHSEWELGSVTDKVNPGDSFTKVATGSKILQLSEILGGVFTLPLGQAFIHKRTYTWERPLAPAATEI